MLSGLFISLFAAIIPTVIHTLIFYWADRYEREPGWLLFVAFLWGAIPAILASILLEEILGIPLASSTQTITGEVVESSIIAPIVEEFFKGFAIWLIFIWKRQEFDGVLDGLLYGALIGFGFAMTEDFFYYIGVFDSGGIGDLSIVIFLRAILFGLNHGFYTGLTGVFFGLSRNMHRGFLRFLLPWIGLGLAIVVHALHNFGVTVAGVNPLGLLLSVLIAFGSVGLLILIVALAWRQERQTIRRELAEEVGVSLSAGEFALLTERWRRPSRWKDREKADRTQLLVELALSKDRLRKRGNEDEPELGQAIADLRTTLQTIHA
ncbi:MAG: PrsW family intramembrane metalloprotease [Caldilineaceae bacterium]